MGPRFLVRAAGLEMHPMDQADRRGYLKDSGGIGFCNITKCCTEVCPEHIKITDNAIIPLKERVADEFYDPVQWFLRKIRGSDAASGPHVELPVLQGGAPGPVGTLRRRRTIRSGRHSGSRLSDPFFPELAGEPGKDEPGAEPAPAGSSIRTDGAARGNPGPASLGAALFDLARPDARDDRAVPDASISDYLGVQTNNVAEYTGVVRALDLARELGAREVHLLLDSKLIVEQLAGRWRVKDAKLIPLWTAAREDPRRVRSVDRRPRAARPEHGRGPLANEAIDRAHAGGEASVVRLPRAERTG